MPGNFAHIDSIHADPFNRPDRTGDDIDGLAATIRLFGLLVPLQVQPYPGRQGHWRLIDGHRRLRACELAGLTEVPITTYRSAAPGTGAMLGLILNTQRAQLGPVEFAQALGRLRREYHMNGTQIARTLGLSPQTVSYHLGLLQLDRATLARIRAGTVPVGAAHEAVRQVNGEAAGYSGTVRRAPGPRKAKPTWFGATHPLAAKAHARCKREGHFATDRYGKTACGPCWETEIRADAALARPA